MTFSFLRAPHVFAIGFCAIISGCSGSSEEKANSPEYDDGKDAQQSETGSGGGTTRIRDAGTGGTGNSDDTNGAGGFIVSPDSGSQGGSFSGGGHSKEVCDGIDNDGNGIIDDVDEGGDGICDCLNIGTIGAIGPYSTGSSIFQKWLGDRGTMPVTALGNQVLTDDLLKPLQVIVVLYVATMQVGGFLFPHHAFSNDEVEALARWVKNGGGILTTIGYTPDEAMEVQNINRLLAPFNVGYSTTNLDLTGFITDWSPHPISASVSNIFTDNGVEPTPTGTTIARDAQGRIALTVAQVEKGKVAVWGDEWITYDSEWQNKTEQQVERLWINLFKWLTPSIQCQVPPPVPK